MRGRTLLLYRARVGRRARARLALVVAPRLDRDRRAPGRAVRGPGLAAAGTTTQTTVACCVARAEGGGGEGGARAPSRSSVAARHPLVPSSRSSRVAAGAIHIYIYYIYIYVCIRFDLPRQALITARSCKRMYVYICMYPFYLLRQALTTARSCKRMYIYIYIYILHIYSKRCHI